MNKKEDEIAEKLLEKIEACLNDRFNPREWVDTYESFIKTAKARRSMRLSIWSLIFED